MVPKDYYLILGVPRQASQNGIRDAYRSLAKQCHPDLAGESGTPDFQNINEAYEVLSDPDQRRSYNRSLERAERAGDDGGRASGGRSAPSGGRSAPHRRSRHRWDDGPPPYQRSGCRGRRFLDVEVILNPAEAAWGVTFDLEVPWLDRCPLCRGTGWEGPFPCFGCDGAGMIRRSRTVRISLPAGVQNGDVFEIFLQRVPSVEIVLRAFVRVR